MSLKKFINNAFEKYEESPELIDFKEELLMNLHDRLQSLEASGFTHEEALREIEIEFADINKIADEMSIGKKQEVFESQYMTLRHFITTQQAIIYTILGVLTAFGVIIAGLSYLSTGEINGFNGWLIVLLSIPLSGFVYMGLTQETATRKPMGSLRASIYTLASFVLLFSLLLLPLFVFSEARSLEGSLMAILPFALPSIGVISFLILTEKELQKAWVLKEEEKHHKKAKQFLASGSEETFGLMTAFVWILAIGAFILLLILKLWIYSWTPFIIAIALTMFLLIYYMNMGNAETFGLMTGVVWVLAIGGFILLLLLKLWIYSWIPFIIAIALTLLLLARYMKRGF